MKIRMSQQAGDDREIGRLEDELRRDDPVNAKTPPPDVYWQNLIVRTNERIDRVSSGKAITLSWAARVAVPGVVALISFLVALHYYVPDYPAVATLPAVVEVLPDATVDSLLTAAIGEGIEGALDDDVAEELLVVRGETAADYLIATASTGSLVDSLEEQDVLELLAVLESARQ